MGKRSLAVAAAAAALENESASMKRKPIMTDDEMRLLAINQIRRRNMTQNELAAEMGISPQYLSDQLHGRRALGDRLLKSLGYRREIRYIREGAE